MIDLLFDEAGEPISEEARSAAREVCDANEPRIRELLPALAERVRVRVNTGKRVIPEIGCGGGALAPGEVYFTVDPDRPEGVEKLVRLHLRSVLFHEFHHLVRGWVMTGGAPRTRFIDGVVCEGLATAFERDFADSNPLWGDYPDSVRGWVDELLALPASAPYAEWMFFHPDGRRWIGYRAGTFIADQAIERSGRSAADLVTTPYLEVLALAGIDAPGPAA